MRARDIHIGGLYIVRAPSTGHERRVQVVTMTTVPRHPHNGGPATVPPEHMSEESQAWYIVAPSDAKWVPGNVDMWIVKEVHQTLGQAIHGSYTVDQTERIVLAKNIIRPWDPKEQQR